MPQVSANGIELEYDTFGDPAAPPLVLVMGLATQMTGWPEPFCESIAAHGFHVIRFDHRDLGLSTLTDTQELRQRAGAAYDRSFRPDGTARQLAALLGSPDRTAGLASVTVPAAVIHGDSDRLVDLSGGYATAAALPATEPLIIAGMGHD